MIALIINADDLGMNAERDRGIFRAFATGVVSSASLVANGSCFATAAAGAREAGMPVGVHLNLSEGSPLTGPIGGVTDDNGRFPGKTALRSALLAGNFDLGAIRRELAAQVERVRSAGLVPDHLDSHQHFHLFPTLAPLVVELAQSSGIAALRRSTPAEPAELDPQGALGAELRLYRSLAGSFEQLLSTAPEIVLPDGLWGMPDLHRLDTERLCQLLQKIPAGRWELMTHPGHGTGSSFNGSQRTVELQALVSDEARNIVRKRGIRLCSFGELK